ncbi:MAG TPA: hypothetical protein VGZ22_16015 [Isosphaeraceae bacterium]|jgi:hypothetical protein|nr:hypothetical protein [Isosphaeraceae bacterium]
MNEPWFNPNLYSWIPGTLLGVFGGTIGGLAGFLAPRGKAKKLVLGLTWGALAYSVLMLAIGIIAYLVGQPYGIWYGFGLAGVIGVGVIGVNIPGIQMAYRRAEERRMRAKDIQV